MVSRAETVFKGVPLNRRGERNVAKTFLKVALYVTKGDETGYFVYYKGSCIPIKFYFMHCFWFLVKYNKKRSCWTTYKLPTEDYNLELPDSKVTDQASGDPLTTMTLTKVKKKIIKAKANQKA